MAPINEHQQGVCPNCGHDELDYGVLEVADDQVFYPWECLSCNAIGEEWYLLQFTNHEAVETLSE